jgi:hypothetical protein
LRVRETPLKTSTLDRLILFKSCSILIYIKSMCLIFLNILKKMNNIIDMITDDIEIGGYVYPNNNEFLPTYWNYDDIYSNIINDYYHKYYTWSDPQLKYNVIPPAPTPPAPAPEPKTDLNTQDVKQHHVQKKQNDSWIFIFIMILAFVLLITCIGRKHHNNVVIDDMVVVVE